MDKYGKISMNVSKNLFIAGIVFVQLFFTSTVLSQPEKPYGLTERVPNTSFLLSTAGDTLAEMEIEIAFSNLSFIQPVYLTNAKDGSDRLFMVERAGKITVFQNQDNVSESKFFLDITDRVVIAGSETGLLSMAFHPLYPDSNKIYVYYTYGNLVTRLSEFRISTNPDSVDENSERVLLTVDQPYSNHNGGQIAFGPDGYLYIGYGDGGSGGDPQGNGQNRQTLLGSIIRIDIDTESENLNYGIPEDNPLIENDNGWREEIWAWGLRNPWRFSFDIITGQLWVGDVGQNAWEEIDLVEKGKNYGWKIMEGFHCYSPSTGCDTTGLTLPVVDYEHPDNSARSVTGGFVYRGTKLSRLYGTYIYADYVVNTIWGLRYENGEVVDHKVLAQSPVSISSFGQDEAGEVYVVGYNGSIFRFVEKEGIPPPFTIPQTISESGLFKNIETLELADGLIPYTVNAPLWSDDAYKTRIIALPDTAKIEFSQDGIWLYPPNAVLVKNFFLEMERGVPDSRKIIETRFLVRHADHEQWDGFSYIWNDEATDADLLSESYTKTFNIRDGSNTITQDYYYPSRSDCITCHTDVTGFILGVKTSQINKQHLFVNQTDSVWDNQLRSYNNIRLFTENIGEDYSEFPKLANPFDETEPIEFRARAYLDANCSNCHQPGSTGRTDLDFRYEVPLEAMHLIGVPPELDDMGVSGSERIKPGYTDSSIVYLRMVDLGSFRMPPLATSMVDIFGTDLIGAWIDSLGVVSNIQNTLPDNLPDNYQLHHAYPNPFNAVTTIKYQLPASSQVQLIIYDIRGREVITLLNGKQPAGHYSVQWNADEFSSGIYFYKLQTEKFIQVRKMVLMK
jgi:uncharacterized repeat protein (TIGR03806 family)